MTGHVLAVAPGGKTVGLCLTRGADVVEAATVETMRKGAALDSVPALVDLGTCRACGR